MHLFTLSTMPFICSPHNKDGPAAEVIVETEILVATNVQELLVGNDKLEGG